MPRRTTSATKAPNNTPRKLRRKWGRPPPRLDWPVGGSSLSSISRDHVDSFDIKAKNDESSHDYSAMKSDAQRFPLSSSFSQSCSSTMSPSISPSPASSTEVMSPAYASQCDLKQGRNVRASLPTATGKKRLKRRGAPTSSVSRRADAVKPLWVDKYTPHNSTDLCMAPSKVKEMRNWMTEFTDNTSYPKLLILVGSPGIGKSTTVRVLTSEMKRSFLEWNDSYQSEYYSLRGSAGGKLDSSGLMSLQYQSQLDSFEEFLHNAGMGYCSLSTITTRDITKSTLETNNSSEEKRPRHSQEPKQTSREGLQNIVSSDNGENKALVLIDALPNLHTQEAAQSFRSIMSRHIQRCKVPTVFVFSNVSEGKHRPIDLEQFIDTQVLYSPLVKIMQCHSVTKAKMRKILTEIARQEQLDELSETVCDEMHSSSNGDLRHAIMSLQFRFAPSCHGKSARSQTNIFGKRDTQLSSFHALGKLLYAKRQKNIEHGNFSQPVFARKRNRLLTDLRPALDFDPEQVMDESDMGHDGSLSFLGFHSPEFFTDVSELSQALDRFSDAAHFLDRSVKQHQIESVFPSAYVASLAGRAVADANKHPAQNRFRQFCAPTIFEVMRKKHDNDGRLFQLCRRLSYNQSQLRLNTNIGLCRLFVTEILPFVKNVLPNEIDFALANMHSIARRDVIQSSPQRDCTSEPQQVGIGEQLNVLQDDDISDYDSIPERLHNGLQTATNKSKDGRVAHLRSDTVDLRSQKHGSTLKLIDVIIID